MHESWRVGVGIHLRVMARGAAPPSGCRELPVGQAASLLRWMRDDGVRGHTMLFEMAEAVAGVAARRGCTPDAALRTVERGLATGWLRAYISTDNEGGGKGPEVVEERYVPPVDEKKTYVAIQLLSDEPEPQPVPFRRYRIVLPDHTVREGKLDQFGRALVPGIDPGTCKVSFPDFDAADWKAA